MIITLSGNSTHIFAYICYVPNVILCITVPLKTRVHDAHNRQTIFIRHTF